MIIQSRSAQEPRAFFIHEELGAIGPDHRVAFAERARHFVMLDEPDWLFRTIDEFLAGADRAGARPAP